MRNKILKKCLVVTFASAIIGTSMVTATSPVTVQAATKKTMLKKYKRYLSSHEGSIQNFSVVYMGKKPALITNCFIYDYYGADPNTPIYSSRNGYAGGTLYFYKKGKVKRVANGDLYNPGGEIPLRYIKGTGILQKGDTMGTSQPWKVYLTKKGVLKEKSINSQKYYKAKLLKAYKNTKNNRRKYVK